jgi:hypothetical protein
LVLAPVLLLAAACGRTELELIGDDSGAAGSGAGAAGTSGSAGRGGTGGGTAGVTGSGGVTGGGGVTGSGGQAAVPIICGPDVCTAGVQMCCVRANGQSCIPTQAMCNGASIGCLDGAACAAGAVCCLAIVGGSTSCVTAQQCGTSGGAVLCATDAQCPNTTPRCCRLGTSGICAALSCPSP